VVEEPPPGRRPLRILHLLPHPRADPLRPQLAHAAHVRRAWLRGHGHRRQLRVHGQPEPAPDLHPGAHRGCTYPARQGLHHDDHRNAGDGAAHVPTGTRPLAVHAVLVPVLHDHRRGHVAAALPAVRRRDRPRGQDGYVHGCGAVPVVHD